MTSPQSPVDKRRRVDALTELPARTSVFGVSHLFAHCLEFLDSPTVAWSLAVSRQYR